jgi:uncharacterized protein involved in cysteine biosynthesis
MYLLHPLMMKTTLVWILYGLIPRFGDGWGPMATPDEYTFMSGLYNCQSPASVMVNLLAVGVWLCLLFLVCTAWNTKMEPWFGIVSQRFEEVMLGKKSLRDFFPRMGPTYSLGRDVKLEVDGKSGLLSERTRVLQLGELSIGLATQKE